FPLVFYLLTSQFQLVTAKYLMPVLPILSLLAMAALLAAWRWPTHRVMIPSWVAWVLLVAVAGGILSPMTVKSVETGQRLSQPDSRQVLYRQLCTGQAPLPFHGLWHVAGDVFPIGGYANSWEQPGIIAVSDSGCSRVGAGLSHDASFLPLTGR